MNLQEFVLSKMDIIQKQLAKPSLNINGVHFHCIPSNETEVECIFDQMLALGYFNTNDTKRFPLILKCDPIGQYDRFCQIELNKTDLGKIIHQAKTPLYKDDTIFTFASRHYDY